MRLRNSNGRAIPARPLGVRYSVAFAGLLAGLVAGLPGCAADPAPPTDAAPIDATALLARYRVDAPQPAADWPGIGLWSDRRARLQARESALLARLANGGAPVQAGLGQIYTEVGEYGRGLYFLSAALTAQPDDPATWVQLGNNRLGSGFPDEALHHYARALELNHDTTSAWAKSGMAHVALHDDASARECFEEALERSPRHIEARLGLARILEESREFKPAREHLERALGWSPDHPTALFRLARVQTALGLHDEARATTVRHERAAILDDLRLREAEVSAAHKAAALGEHYLADGRLTDALREFRSAYERAADDAERAVGLAGLVRCARRGAVVEELDARRAELDQLDPEHTLSRE